MFVLSGLCSEGIAQVDASTRTDVYKILAREYREGTITQAEVLDIALRFENAKRDGCSDRSSNFAICEEDLLHNIAVIGTDQRSAVKTEDRRMASVGHVVCIGKHQTPEGRLVDYRKDATATIVVPSDPNHARQFETVLTAKHTFYSPSGIKFKECSFNSISKSGEPFSVDLVIPTDSAKFPLRVTPNSDKNLFNYEEDIAITKINQRLTACPEGKDAECGTSVASMQPRPDLVPWPVEELTQVLYQDLITNNVDFEVVVYGYNKQKQVVSRVTGTKPAENRDQSKYSGFSNECYDIKFNGLLIEHMCDTEGGASGGPAEINGLLFGVHVGHVEYPKKKNIMRRLTSSEINNLQRIHSSSRGQSI